MFQKWMKFNRELLGMEQREFAQNVGLSQPFITLIELGKRNPSPKARAKIVSFINSTKGEFSLQDLANYNPE